MKHLARTLRKKQTDAERRLWQHLRNRQLSNFKFRRQHVIGSYIVDFFCLEANLVVEIDGGQHAEQVEYDERRTAFLESQGLTILRFWNNEVLEEIDAVLAVIHGVLVGREDAFQPSPRPSPNHGRGRNLKEGVRG